MADPSKQNDPQPTKREQDFWEKIIILLNHKETSHFLKLMRYHQKITPLLETFITLMVALFLIGSLIWLVNRNYIDKGSFGVMFGTVFGYMLSWRFGK